MRLRAAYRAPWGAVTRVVRREPMLFALLAFAAAFFAYRWAVSLSRPTIGEPEPSGWQTFHDQGYYLLEAKRLGELRSLPQEIFLYGPGYPIIAAPFANFGRFGWPYEDPFLIGNVAVWLLTITATYLVGRRLYGEVAGVAAALAVMLATPLIENVVQPWNSTASLGALMVTTLVALERTPRWWHGAILGVAVAWAYSARYVDALWVGIAVVAILLARGVFARRDFRLLAATVVAGVVALAPTLYLQWSAFGSPLRTSYSTAAVNPVTVENFDLGNIGPHAVQTFFSPWFFPEEGFKSATEPLLSSMFLIVLAPLGYLLLLKASVGGRRTLVIGYGFASLAATLFYLAYYFTGSKGLEFQAQHFFKMWWPLWTIAAVAAVAEAMRRLQPASRVMGASTGAPRER
jgi:hypothetical protein